MAWCGWTSITRPLEKDKGSRRGQMPTGQRQPYKATSDVPYAHAHDVDWMRPPGSRPDVDSQGRRQYIIAPRAAGMVSPPVLSSCKQRNRKAASMASPCGFSQVGPGGFETPTSRTRTVWHSGATGGHICTVLGEPCDLRYSEPCELRLVLLHSESIPIVTKNHCSVSIIVVTLTSSFPIVESGLKCGCSRRDLSPQWPLPSGA